MSFIPQKSQPHPRRAIRARVRELLLQYVDIGGRVFLSRLDPAFLSEMPCLAVYLAEETIEIRTRAPLVYKRRLTLSVDILGSDRPNITGDTANELDDEMDSRAFEIEYALLHQRYLGLAEWLQDVQLIGTSAVELIFQGEMSVQALRMLFEIVYLTEALEVLTLDEFLRFDSKIQTTDGAQSEDRVTIREE
jgi:hypothetical protein